MKRPHRTFELNVHVDGDTWEDIIRELHHLARHIEQHGQECSSVGGGYSTGHIVSIHHDPEMTGDRYRELLDEYLEEVRKSEDAEVSSVLFTPVEHYLKLVDGILAMRAGGALSLSTEAELAEVSDQLWCSMGPEEQRAADDGVVVLKAAWKKAEDE